MANKSETEDGLVDRLRELIREGKSGYQAAYQIAKEGGSALKMSTLLWHAQDVQREVWIEQGIDVTRYVLDLEELGEVEVPKRFAREVRRLAIGAELRVREYVVFRRVKE